MCMDLYVKTIIWSAAIFLAILWLIASPPQYTRRILGWAATITAICALCMYGYGYSKLSGLDAVTVLYTVFDSCRIFTGSNNWEKIKDAFELYPMFWTTLFWIIQLVALTTSASAVVTSLGSRMLKWIRLRIFRIRDITLIFGLNENTLEFGRAMVEQGKTALLYIDQTEQAKLQTAVDQMGAIFRCDPDALEGTVRFLKSIGLRKGKRKLRVFALDRSMVANQRFARNLLNALEAWGVSPEQTSLTILSVSEETDNPMQARPGRYGYGSLMMLDEPEMVARILARNYPPYKTLTFDSNGKATEDFFGIIIGFGQLGQAVLRQLVMNSQFYGSTSRIAVFAPDYEQRMGWISHECREMLKYYNIEIYPYDGRSSQLYDYLEEHAESINYVAVCAGNETVNLEIGERMQMYLQRRNCGAPVLLCNSRGVSHLSAGEYMVSRRIYVPEILCSDQLDRMAMVLNQSYQQTGDMLENWKNCSYFDRMSSRAAADFYDALLYCAGITKEEAITHWDPRGELLENLAASEHLRWNAFHYCMGFRPMTEEEFQERAEKYPVLSQKDSGYRITKDVEKRLHACMIPWEQLDDYSTKENAITGAARNYAENDRNNVRDLVKVLRAME